MPPEWQLRDVPAEVARLYHARGWWRDETLGQALAAGLDRAGGRDFRIHSRTRPWAGTLGEVAGLARALAGGLQARGLGPGDVVAFQVPNWLEAAVTFYAASFLGAVLAPIVHFYGRKEVGHILRQSRARALVTADRFGHLDYLANLESLRPQLPDLELVAVVSADRPALTPGPVPPDAVPFAALLDGPSLNEPLTADPASPSAVAYTSGTTADPKGVVHSHRTLGFEVRQLGALQAQGARPALTGAPVAHGIGMLSGLLLPLDRGQPIHLTDVWNPGQVLADMAEFGLTAGSGATYFLTSLLDEPALTPRHLELMGHIGLGGASVPRAVAERARGLGISLVRMYGSTEHPSTTGATHDDPAEKRLNADGRALPGVELRIVDDAGRDLAPGTAGEIVSRGPDCFLGYSDPALTREAFDREGWFSTGDVGVLDEDGWLTITDRKKDVIIRGGENVSAVEVEELLARLPGVAEVAVVAAPDARLGEHACAFVRALPGAPAPDLAAIRSHLEAAGLARPKWPEELRLVEDFPRTPSGKVQKFALRQRLREEAAAPTRGA
ncbi:MAG TPA: AMP-binding protein [Acidimicrobiales bacterium]|nr:AMP-binding protein [Acidimicrobiales bacterium]